jgi:hypothetical protein
MIKTGRILIRATPDEVARLQALATLTGRTKSDVVRVLLAQVRPEHVNIGIQLPNTTEQRVTAPEALQVA